jgi:CTP:molybdopterin cytidylyltransferase MocA
MSEGIAALLLAAGRSRRMGAGRLKQLLPYGDRTAVRRCVDSLREAGVERVVAVVAPREELRAAFAGLSARLVENPDPESDMRTSVHLGLGALGADAGAVLICLADHPLVRPATIRALAAEHAAHPGTILAPAWRGRRGHPVLFPRAALNGVAAGLTLREARDAWPGGVREVGVDDEGVVVDVDTPQDYARARALAEREVAARG